MRSLSVATVITFVSSGEKTVEVNPSECFPTNSHTILPDFESQIFADLSYEHEINHLSSRFPQLMQLICLEWAFISWVHLILYL